MDEPSGDMGGCPERERFAPREAVITERNRIPGPVTA